MEVEEKARAGPTIPTRSPSCVYLLFLWCHPLSTFLCLSTIRPLYSASWDTLPPSGGGDREEVSKDGPKTQSVKGEDCHAQTLTKK